MKRQFFYCAFVIEILSDKLLMATFIYNYCGVSK